MDVRHEPSDLDLQLAEYLNYYSIPFLVVATKADKLSRQALTRNIDNYLERLSQEWEPLPPYFITSSETRQGREELLSYIEAINNEIAANK